MKKICAHCGQEYEAQRDLSRYCGDACRQAAYRERLAAKEAKAVQASN